jgi:formate dehydrogenase alpha subunit
MCPTGALSAKNSNYVGTAERVSLSICGFCGVGCSLAMGVVGEKIVEAEPSHRQDTVNGATLCVRGHFAHDFLNSRERLSQPLVRKNGSADNQMVPVPWDGLLEEVAGRLRAIQKKHGPRSIAFFGSSKCTNEENYLFQKIARALLQTNNVDNGGYLYGRSILNMMDNSTGDRCFIRPLADLEKAEAVFVLGADPVQSVPVVSYYLKRAAIKGVPVVVADTRPTELADSSSLSFYLAPHSEADGTYVELINGLAALLYGKNGQDTDFIERFTEGFKQYADSLASLDPESINRVTGLDNAVLASAAKLLQNKKITFLVGSTILQQPYGRQTIEALVNLSLMTGSLESNAAGIHVIARENNLIGAWDMGTVPDALPGRQALNDESSRKRFEQAWQTELSPDEGLDLVGMIEAAEKGELKALYILGENPLRGLPQADRIQKALAKVEYIVVQDILNSETSKMADVVLPGAAFSEKGGSFTNMEGRVQSFDSAVSPPGDARPDWEILGRLASELGHPEPYESLEDLVDEIRRTVPMYADLKRSGHSAWVKAPDRQADNNGEDHENRIPFTPVSSLKKHGQDPAFDAAYPFTAVFTSQRWHMGSGTRTACSQRVTEFGLKGDIEISARDGAKLDLNDGDTVKAFSRHGTIKRSIRLNHRLSPGQICVPLAFSGNDVMNLIELTQPGRPGFAGWNTCRVNLEKVEEIIHES